MYIYDHTPKKGIQRTCQECNDTFFECRSCYRGRRYCSEGCRKSSQKRQQSKRHKKYAQSAKGKAALKACDKRYVENLMNRYAHEGGLNMPRSQVLAHHKKVMQAKKNAESDKEADKDPPISCPKPQKKIYDSREIFPNKVKVNSTYFPGDQTGYASRYLDNRPRCIACGHLITFFDRGSDTS